MNKFSAFSKIVQNNFNKTIYEYLSPSTSIPFDFIYIHKASGIIYKRFSFKERMQDDGLLCIAARRIFGAKHFHRIAACW